MLKHLLIHPKINEVIGRAGHHARILIADGNYPAVPIDAVNTMGYETEGPYALTEDPPVWDEYRQVIVEAGLPLKLEPIFKWDFYEAVATPDHVLTIQTADQQRFANILLSVGVRMD
jgi:L-fucose mutarotase